MPVVRDGGPLAGGLRVGATTAVPGAELESVFATGPGDVYGLRAGDVVTGWRQGEDSGDVGSSVAARRVEDERAPHGGLVLEILRAGGRLEVPVASGSWEVDWTEAADFAAAADVAEDADPLDRAASLMLRAAAGSEADDADRDARREALEEALELRRSAAPDSVSVAVTIFELAGVLPPAEREPLLLEARDLLERRAPSGVEMANVLNALGIVTAVVDRRLDDAIALYRQALDLRERWLPGSWRVASTYANLARCARLQGRLDDAEELMQQGLENYS